MKPILVCSIRFDQKEMGLGGRVLSFTLNTGTAMTWDWDCGTLRLLTSKKNGRITGTEQKIAYLVLDACAAYMDDRKPESMSYAECAACNELALHSFDWAGAGYDADGDPTDKYMTLAGYIACYTDI